VTIGTRAEPSITTVRSKWASSSLTKLFQYDRAMSQAAPFGAEGLPWM
jgi:hypothetical protein